MKNKEGLIVGIIILVGLVIVLFFVMSSNTTNTTNQALTGLSYSPFTPLLIPNSTSNNLSSQNASGYTTSGNETVTYEGAPVI